VSGSETNRLSDLQESTPVADAARRVLAVRLETVRDCLDKALRTAGDRRKSIHALRVATRRAAAAIDVFAACLPRRVFKEARASMRTLRRAVGFARDWDVVLQQLARQLETATEAERPAIDMLHGYAIAHRIPAQRRLEAACPDHPFGFDRLMAKCIAAVRYRGTAGDSFGSHVLPIIGRLVANLNTRAADGDGDWGRLHDVRIAGKRLRYSLELVQDSFGGPCVTQLCPALEALQEKLGRVNDSFNAVGLLRQLADGMRTTAPAAARRYGEFLDRQIAAHEAVMHEGRQAYREWLASWNGADMQDSLRSLSPDITCRHPIRGVVPAAGPIDPEGVLGRIA
jgi:CHAD domain-containing protein